MQFAKLYLNEALSCASQLRFLTSLYLDQMVYTAPGLFSAYLPYLSELRVLSINDPKLRLSSEDSDAICKLPQLESFTIDLSNRGYHFEGIDKPQAQRVSISPPTAEGARALTNIGSLCVPGAFLTPRVIADAVSLSRLTHLYVSRGKLQRKS